MHRLDSLLGGIVRITSLIGVLSLAAMMALTVFTVIFRAIGVAFPGTYVLTELLLIPCVSFALAYTAWSGSHTKVDLLTQFFPKRLSDLSNGLMLILGTVFWGFVAFAGYEEAIRRGKQGETTPLLDIPVAPFRWLMVAALSLLIVICVVRAVQMIVGWRAKS